VAYRVIQWATGGMGKQSLRSLIDHPEIELVGLYVHSEGKIGLDAGDIARRAKTGVIATNDIDTLLAIPADVVIHCPRLIPPYGSDEAELVRILESGKNVISINGHTRPDYWGGARAAALEAACAKGGVTLMNAGINPGFIAEQVAIVATGICSQLDHIEVIETADARLVQNPQWVFDINGFGGAVDDFDKTDKAWPPAAAFDGMFEETLAAMAAHLGLVLERVDTDHRVFGATTELHVAAGVIPKGRISHINLRYRGIVDGQNKLGCQVHWHMEETHLDEPDPPLWRVKIEGQPGVKVAVDVLKRPDDPTRTEAEQFALAGSIINAIPIICAAPPGVKLRPMATPIQGKLDRRAEVTA